MLARDSHSATLVDLTRRALAGPARDVLFERDAGGAWTGLSNDALVARADAVALELRARGVGVGDRVALMSANRVDWIVANLGILFAGAVTVPIYATQAPDQAAYIVADSGARAVIVEHRGLADRLRAAGVGLEPVIFDLPAEDERAFAALLAAGEARRTDDPSAVAGLTADVDPGDLAVLIYTSGTTGTPKGVMLSHRNMTTTAEDAFGLVVDAIRPGDAVLSILPLAHIYENTNIFGYLLRGASIYVNRRIEALLDDLRDVRPVAVFAVPRIFERTYAGIIARSVAAGGLRARLVPWALGVGLAFRRAVEDGAPGLGLRVRYGIAHRLVLGKLRAQLGCDRLRFFVSGSASLHRDIALTFASAGIDIMEGYGLTECSPVVTVNHPGAFAIGTVGRPIPHVDVRLGDDGELLVRGPNVMLGYYHRPEETAATIVDGWLHTGDIASIDANGYVRIVGRKKEIFKTSGGKYVSPSRVETALARSPFVNQVVVIGDGKPHPAALIAPNWTAVRAELGLADDVPAGELTTRAEVRRLMERECERTTADLASFEQIRWIGILPRDLTVEDGEITPTLKVRRQVVESRYAGLIHEFA